MATATVTAHKSIPYLKIAKMWLNGDSYEKIAKAVGRFHEDKADKTKSVRAIVSRMLNEGYHDENGKSIILKPREGMRAFGMGKKAPKAKGTAKKVGAPKAVAAKTAKVAGKRGRQLSEKNIVIALEPGKPKFVRVEMGTVKGLVKLSKLAKAVLESVNEAEELAKTTVTHAEPILPTDMPNAPTPQTETAPTGEVTVENVTTETPTETNEPQTGTVDVAA